MTEELKAEIDKILQLLNGLGWCKHEKAYAMAEAIIADKCELCVEIGVFGGRSFLSQAAALRASTKGLIIGIDPWRVDNAVEGTNDPANDDWWKKLDLHAIHRDCMKALWHCGLSRHAQVWRCTSLEAWEAVHHFATEPVIDMLHIDGNHSQEQSCKDVHLWLPLLRRGGSIWFDDIDWASTSQARKMVESVCTHVATVSNCAQYRKP